MGEPAAGSSTIRADLYLPRAPLGHGRLGRCHSALIEMRNQRATLNSTREAPPKRFRGIQAVGGGSELHLANKMGLFARAREPRPGSATGGCSGGPLAVAGRLRPLVSPSSTLALLFCLFLIERHLGSAPAGPGGRIDWPSRWNELSEMSKSQPELQLPRRGPFRRFEGPPPSGRKWHKLNLGPATAAGGSNRRPQVADSGSEPAHDDDGRRRPASEPPMASPWAGSEWLALL